MQTAKQHTHIDFTVFIFYKQDEPKKMPREKLFNSKLLRMKEIFRFPSYCKIVYVHTE